MQPASEPVASLVQQAMTFHQEGHVAAAQEGYLRVLQLDPDHVATLGLLGVIYLQTHRARQAVEIFSRAIALDAANAMLHINRGSAFAMLDEHAAAIACYDTAIALDPESNAVPFYNRGTALQQLGRHREAIASFDQAIALESDLDGNAYYARGIAQMAVSEHAAALESLEKAIDFGTGYLPEAWYSRGSACAALNEWRAAIENYDACLAADPERAAAFFSRGNAFSQLEMWEAALTDYDKALAFEPRHAEAHSNRGHVLSELERWADALTSLDAAIRLNPNQAVAHYNRGNALRASLRFEDALASYDRAIELDGQVPQFFCNRGVVREELQAFEAALEDYDRAIALQPKLAEAHSNRGNVLIKLDRFDAALTSHDAALALDPDCADCHYNKAFSLLLTGKLREGWPQYEWRWRQRKKRSLYGQESRDHVEPRWTGRQALADKTLFLYGEQGLGDTIQFCRYVPLAAHLGARVILEAPAALCSLLGSLSGLVDLVRPGVTPWHFDYHSSLMSLPAAFDTSLETIPRVVPYLRSSREKSEFWRSKLGAKHKPRVGLVWSGGFRPQPELWALNAQRNIPLETLQPFKAADVEWFSLQKGQPAASELADLVQRRWDGPSLVDYTGLIEDFSDTAALVEQLDLVITVDTSTAHLAGALGKPVWILNRYDTCWRWMIQRPDSPWYPTARIYRQERRGDWDGVVQRVLSDLRRL